MIVIADDKKKVLPKELAAMRRIREGRSPEEDEGDVIVSILLLESEYF